MQTFVVTPCANASAVCYHRQLHRRGETIFATKRNFAALSNCQKFKMLSLIRLPGLCLDSTSSQQLSTVGIPPRTRALGLRRGLNRGSKWIQRNSQRGPRADSETEERSSVADSDRRAAGGLDELDNQLRVLSSSDSAVREAKEASKVATGNEEELPRKEFKRVDWPVFGDDFLLYSSGALILLTIVNNFLYRVLTGPPAPRPPPTQGTGVPQGSKAPQGQPERYKLRSFNDPKYYLNAPPVSDKPSS